jgi:hypothetical protein
MRVTLFKVALKDSASGCSRSTHGAHEGVHRGCLGIPHLTLKPCTMHTDDPAHRSLFGLFTGLMRRS